MPTSAVEDDDAVAARALRHVEGMIGRGVELLGRSHRRLEAGDAERAGHADAPAAAGDVELLARGAEPLGQAAGAVARRFRAQHDELFAADAGQQLLRAEQALEAVRQRRAARCRR